MTYGTIPFLEKPVSKLVMGVIPLRGKLREEAFAILDAYRAGGGNCIDNGHIYGDWAGAIMKAYFQARGEDALIRLDKGNHHGAAGRRVTKADLDSDLRTNHARQGVSVSDIYLLHRDDPSVPAGDVVEWLNEHRRAGRVRAFGGSNWRHERIQEANDYAEEHGLQGFSVSSPNLSLAVANEPMWWEALSISDDLAARAWYQRTRFPIFSWSSGGGGYFADVESDDVRRVYENATNAARKRRLRQMASDKGITPTRLALAWTLNQPMEVWALIGPGSVEQMEDNLGATEVRLSADELAWLEHG